mmetsp:Transcript_957/g.2288  ORF Transcript_957/g.2288 Transcript_957/m.2288 type:complete len:994 (+) Transcript_957:1-2982(+)
MEPSTMSNPFQSVVPQSGKIQRPSRPYFTLLILLLLLSDSASPEASQLPSTLVSYSSPFGRALRNHNFQRLLRSKTSAARFQNSFSDPFLPLDESAFIFSRLLKRRRNKHAKEKDQPAQEFTLASNYNQFATKNRITTNDIKKNVRLARNEQLKSEGDRYVLLSRASNFREHGKEVESSNSMIGYELPKRENLKRKGRRSSNLDPEWTKRNARSIDEGIRFKSQLREGLEEQSKLYRERLLNDLLQGVISGGSSALETIERKGSGPLKWFSSFGRGDDPKADTKSSSSSEADDGVGENPGENTSREAAKVNGDNSTDVKSNNGIFRNSNPQSRFGARTIAGLINALAEEADDLEVEVDADPTTPIWNKKVNSIKVYFSRLGFKQLRMGGLNEVFYEIEESLDPSEKFSLSSSLFGNANKTTTANEAFDRIDKDNSGALDAEELTEALKMAAMIGGSKIGIRSKDTVAELASRLIRLYDANGDGVVDKEEYRVMVQDMAALRDARIRKELQQDTDTDGADLMVLEEDKLGKKKGWKQIVGQMLPSVFRGDGGNSASSTQGRQANNNSTISGDFIDVTENVDFWSSMDQGEGSIVLSDLRLDLRRLVFGAIPLAKRILPGGPLILKPFTATITASFNREDILDSFVLDAGLRRLVARALSRRVRGVRDFLDGAVFYGRTWKLFEQSSPLVEVPKLQDVQFDKRDRLIITGRAKIKASPDAPSIENGFKLRTKIGTRDNGRIIGLLEPEIAIFAECPKEIEEKVREACKKWFDYTIPHFKPLYTYIPLVSPLKKNDKLDGFNMGDDNQIKSIEIKNGKLRFEISAVLRPGRFLGNHYLAFTVPIRTLIITVDRVKEGMRVARRNKLLADKAARELERLAAAQIQNAKINDGPYDELYAQSLSGKSSISDDGKSRIRRLEKEIKATIQEDAMKKEIEANSDSNNGKSFLTRFVEGYSGAIREELDLEMNARLSSSISDFFGSQDSDDDDSTSSKIEI